MCVFKENMIDCRTMCNVPYMRFYVGHSFPLHYKSSMADKKLLFISTAAGLCFG